MEFNLQETMYLSLVTDDSLENVRDERAGWNVFFLFNKGDIDYKIYTESLLWERQITSGSTDISEIVKM